MCLLWIIFSLSPDEGWRFNRNVGTFKKHRTYFYTILTRVTFYFSICFYHLVTGPFLKLSLLLLCEAIIFFVGNSQLNCRIIESILDISLVYLSLHMLVHRLMSFIAVHVTKICCFDFVILNFHLVTLKMRYFEFCYFERLCIFRFELHETSFKNSTTFCGKFMRTKDEFRRTSFALLLHNTVASKVIAERMKRLLPGMIHHNQSG